MQNRIIRAHYDGTKVVLDEEVDLEIGAKVQVWYLTPEQEMLLGHDAEKIEAAILAEITKFENHSKN